MSPFNEPRLPPVEAERAVPSLGRRVFGAGVNGLCFLAGLLAVALALGALAPLREVYTVTEKLRAFAQSGEQFDTLFLGSSRTYRQVMPQLVEEAAAAAGKKVRIFNLGVDGMLPPEDTFVLEQALAARRAPLRHVVVECNNLGTSVRPRDADTMRMEYWHDWKRFSAICRAVQAADARRKKKRSLAERAADMVPKLSTHAGYFLRNFVRAGQGSELLLGATAQGYTMQSAAFRADGHKPQSPPKYMDAKTRAEYEATLAAQLAKPAEVYSKDVGSLGELAEKRRLIERAGAKMILIVAPYPAERMFKPPQGPDSVPLVDFSDPAKFPALFAPENRADESHTNGPGSVLYSQELGRSLAPHFLP